MPCNTNIPHCIHTDTLCRCNHVRARACAAAGCLCVYICLGKHKSSTNSNTSIELCSISITEMQTTNGINSQLSITHSDRQDSGVYKCIAENPFGKSEHVIYVAVQGMYTYFRPENRFICHGVCVYKAFV